MKPKRNQVFRDKATLACLGKTLHTHPMSLKIYLPLQKNAIFPRYSPGRMCCSFDIWFQKAKRVLITHSIFIYTLLKGIWENLGLPEGVGLTWIVIQSQCDQPTAYSGFLMLVKCWSTKI